MTPEIEMRDPGFTPHWAIGLKRIGDAGMPARWVALDEMRALFPKRREPGHYDHDA